MKLEEEKEGTKSASSAFLFKAGTPQQQIDSVVWRAFKGGDRTAFDYLFQKYVKLLYTYGGKITKDQNLVEDCIQDLFVELWQKRELISEVNSVKFYLLKSLRRRVVRRIAADKTFSRKEAEAIEGHGQVELPEEFKMIEEQVTYEQQENLFRALSVLTERQREAIYLKFYEKVTYEELAEIMNLGIKSAYNIIGKAIESLRKNIRS